ncbi:hypothetical protein Tco_0653973 [Tanacetum coccineum]|uniref:Reverse transcriptase Ty1/copia-type domain-containing protein n=1 Tax=Tanacetum coccineum TaxID=301880 RepID=A0ABQ4X1X1_9ASTR
MYYCRSIGTDHWHKPKLDVDLSGEPLDQSDYRSKIGSLMYLTSSRPDLVQAVPLHGLLVSKRSSGFELTAFLYADHAYALILEKALLEGLHSCDKLVRLYVKETKLQTAMSSAEAEYVALSSTIAISMAKPPTLSYKATPYSKPLPEDRFLYLGQRIGMKCLTPSELEFLYKLQKALKLILTERFKFIKFFCEHDPPSMCAYKIFLIAEAIIREDKCLIRRENHVLSVLLSGALFHNHIDKRISCHLRYASVEIPGNVLSED